MQELHHLLLHGQTVSCRLWFAVYLRTTSTKGPHVYLPLTSLSRPVTPMYGTFPVCQPYHLYRLLLTLTFRQLNWGWLRLFPRKSCTTVGSGPELQYQRVQHLIRESNQSPPWYVIFLPYAIYFLYRPIFTTLVIETKVVVTTCLCSPVF